MDEETDRSSNLCMDLVSLKKYEPGVKQLLGNTPPGRWVPVRDLYQAAGIGDPRADSLLAAWLPSPSDPSHSVIVFLDDTTKWCQTADYNAARLLGSRTPVSLAAAS
jgi:hypothetical protein